MLEISYLKGYAGLRLKKDTVTKIKAGVNLIIGKNGSGKSNFAELAKYIFNHQGNYLGFSPK